MSCGALQGNSALYGKIVNYMSFRTILMWRFWKGEGKKIYFSLTGNEYGCL